jgi:hypothetical protein
VTPLISKEFYGDDAEQAFVIPWGYLLEEQGNNSRTERQRRESSGCLEVVCFKGATFLSLNPATQKVVRTFAHVSKAATVFIVGSQVVLQVCQVRRQRLGNRPRSMPRAV